MTDSDVSFEAVSAEQAIDVFYHGWVYRIAAAKLLCQSCQSRTTFNGFVNETDVEGVQGLAFGVSCKTCGDETVHIAYLGSPADREEGLR